MLRNFLVRTAALTLLVSSVFTALLTGCTASSGKTSGSTVTASGSSSEQSTTSGSGDSSQQASSTSSDHEPITIMDAQRDYTKLIELVHERYPEINIEVVPYRGRNMSAYMSQQLKTGSMPDIYSSTQAWNVVYQKEHLIDLSHYNIVNKYIPARLNEYTYDGSLYLLPYDYSIVGILCNKSLLERHGLDVPESFAQLRDETIPALKGLGITPSVTLLDLPGAAFQYFFNVSSTAFMNTLEGRNWRSSFVDTQSDTYAADSADFLECTRFFQEWIDCGMLSLDEDSNTHSKVLAKFNQGETAFLVGTVSRFSQNDDGSGDQYVLLPYLSMDGTSNTYITSPGRLYGLNKELEEPGNEQKLEDALHFLEVLSTTEGYRAIHGESSNNMCAISDFTLSENSPYAEPLKAVSNGHAMNLLYVGWENYLVPFGEAVCDWIAGTGSADEAVSALDETKRSVQSSGPVVYPTVTEELSTVQAAQLTGQMFMAATGADAALISYNVYDKSVPATYGNSFGANGHILVGDMTAENITTFLPTGWYDTITTAELKGNRIMELAAQGCDCRDIGFYYPYVLMTRDGSALKDDETYTVVLCGYTTSEKDALGITDTGIVGLDAAKEYLSGLEELSTATLDDSLVLMVDGEAR